MVTKSNIQPGQELIAYVERHSRVVEVSANASRPTGTVIDLKDRAIITANNPEADALRKLVRLHATFTPVAHKGETVHPTHFDPFNGGLYSHIDLDKWFDGLHHAWQTAQMNHQTPSRKPAQALPRDELKTLSLRFMAVACAVDATKLMTPQTLIIGSVEDIMAAEDARIKRELTRLLSEVGAKNFATDPRALKLAQDEAVLMERRAGFPEHSIGYFKRGFYAITTEQTSRPAVSSFARNGGPKPAPFAFA